MQHAHRVSEKSKKSVSAFVILAIFKAIFIASILAILPFMGILAIIFWSKNVQQYGQVWYLLDKCTHVYKMEMELIQFVTFWQSYIQKKICCQKIPSSNKMSMLLTIKSRICVIQIYSCPFVSTSSAYTSKSTNKCEPQNC